MSSVLVTGGAGFIGFHVCQRLLERSIRVVALDNFNDFYDPAIKRQNVADLSQYEQFALHEGDICNRSTVEAALETHSIDAVIHLAARAGVRPSLNSPALYYRVNCEGTLNLLEASRSNGIERFVLASSSSVYGNNDKVPFSEADPVDHPVSPYAATKKACELLAHTYAHLYGMNVSCLRFFTVYGPRQRPEMAIHHFIDTIQRGNPITLFGDGSSSRDYTFVDDIVDGVMSALERCQGYRVYNLGNSEPIELSALITLIEGALGKQATIEHVGMQPGDVMRTFADISRAREELSYVPQVSTSEGIRRMVEWYLTRQDG